MSTHIFPEMYWKRVGEDALDISEYFRSLHQELKINPSSWAFKYPAGKARCAFAAFITNKPEGYFVVDVHDSINFTDNLRVFGPYESEELAKKMAEFYMQGLDELYEDI